MIIACRSKVGSDFILTVNIVVMKKTEHIDCATQNKPSVSGSRKKTSKQSMKFVPLKGSPPIPAVKVYKWHC